MSKALRNVNLHQTVQTSQAKPGQVKNSAGGFVFKVSDQSRLERFLIIGTDGGTYYVGEHELTQDNIDFVTEFLRKDAKTAIDTVVNISDSGRALRNSPAIFTLALAMNTVSEDMKPYVRQAVNKVCRTATHLFEFNQYIENLGGWGRAKRKAVAEWYTSKSPSSLAYQAIKYRQRNGWTHRDALRISHAKLGPEYAGTVNWILGKNGQWNAGNVPSIILGFEHAQATDSIDTIVSLVHEYNLPWEAIPTQFHKEPKLWKALLESDSLGQTALLRNVTRMAKIGAFKDLQFAGEYAKRLADKNRIVSGRMHPVQYLNAAVTYAEGQVDRKSYYGYRQDRTWDTNSKISAALNEGYYNSFEAVEPANKRTFIAVDVSGSMSSPAMGIDLSCAQVAGAMAMTIARTEPYSDIRGFTSSSSNRWGGGRDSGLTDLGISETTDLTDAMRKVQMSNWGGTDCSLPMTYALQNGIEIDTFVIITDNDTWAGKIHPFQALKQYRKEMKIDARLAVLGVASTEFTIADPSDAGTMDFVGFDSSAPKLLTEFSAGRV